MKKTYLVYAILVFGIIMSITLPHITALVLQPKTDQTTYETSSTTKLTNAITTNKSVAKVVKTASNMELAIATPEIKEEPQEVKEVEEIKEEVKEEQIVEEPTKSYGEMTTDELISAIANGTFKLEYSKAYDTNTNSLTKSKGVVYYDNHKETYYSQKVLKGASLNIPGRHVADDGTVRDQDGYISVAANSSYLSKGTVVKTSLGPAKVYDSGCASGIIDIYTDW